VVNGVVGRCSEVESIDGDEETVVERADKLIARVSRGDRDALTELYEENQRPLLSYLRVLTSDNTLAEEILQDTLYAVWTGASGFAGRSNGRTWLFGIARRRARDLMRKRSMAFEDIVTFESMPAIEPEPDDVVMALESADAMVSTFERMSLAHREVLLLTFVHGLSYQELSEVLGIPLGTVKSRLFAAKRELRAKLNGSVEFRR
jgi:RNA polymerase sigma-70 factor (ECF subfamily)